MYFESFMFNIFINFKFDEIGSKFSNNESKVCLDTYSTLKLKL